MTAPVTDPADWRRSVVATGLLRTFNEAGVLEAADVLVAQRLTALAEDAEELVALAVAFVVRAVRGGSVCIDLAEVAGQVGSPDLPWPQPAQWLQAVSESPLVTDQPVLHLDAGLLYLDRYWIEECRVAEDVLALAGAHRSGTPPDIGCSRTATPSNGVPPRWRCPGR